MQFPLATIYGLNPSLRSCGTIEVTIKSQLVMRRQC